MMNLKTIGVLALTSVAFLTACTNEIEGTEQSVQKEKLIPVELGLYTSGLTRANAEYTAVVDADLDVQVYKTASDGTKTDIAHNTDGSANYTIANGKLTLGTTANPVYWPTDGSNLDFYVTNTKTNANWSLNANDGNILVSSLALGTVGMNMASDVVVGYLSANINDITTAGTVSIVLKHILCEASVLVKAPDVPAGTTSFTYTVSQIYWTLPDITPSANYNVVPGEWSAITPDGRPSAAMFFSFNGGQNPVTVTTTAAEVGDNMFMVPDAGAVLNVEYQARNANGALIANDVVKVDASTTPVGLALAKGAKQRYTITLPLPNTNVGADISLDNWPAQ